METTWHTPNGWLLVQDFLLIGPARQAGRRAQYRRAPSDSAAIGNLVRLATCIGGRVEVVTNCIPLLDYGTTMVTWEYDEAEIQSMSSRTTGEGPSLTLTSSITLGTVGARSYGRTTLEAGSLLRGALVGGNRPDHPGPSRGRVGNHRRLLAGLARCRQVPGSSMAALPRTQRLTLKGLSYAPTGAIMAASTTSLPETPGGARNWDYRFTWIRDSAFMLRSLYRLGFEWEALEYFAFILEAVGGPSPARAGDCRSCTASAASVISPSTRSTI